MLVLMRNEILIEPFRFRPQNVGTRTLQCERSEVKLKHLPAVHLSQLALSF